MEVKRGFEMEEKRRTVFLLMVENRGELKIEEGEMGLRWGILGIIIIISF